MKTPEEHFEPLRQEHLSEQFPGDLAEIVGVGSSSNDDKPTKPSANQQSGEWLRLSWAVAALLLIGLTVGTIWWVQNKGDDPIAELDPAKTDPKSKQRRAIGFFQTSRSGVVQLRSTISRSNQRSSRLLSSSTFSGNRRKSRRTRFWGSGRNAVAQNRAPRSDGSLQKKQNSKPGQRPRFRNQFRFEPIQYRRS